MEGAKFIFIFNLILIAACSKKKNFDFPKGTWEVKYLTFGVDGYSYTNAGNIGNFTFNSNIIGETCVMEYNGSNKLFFNSEKNKDYFKIKKIEIIKDSIFFNSSNKSLKGYLTYKMNLVNNFGKNFVFQYSIINDSIIVGEYWIKNQDYYRYDAPNIGEIQFHQNSTGITETFHKELLGVYHLKK